MAAHVLFSLVDFVEKVNPFDRAMGFVAVAVGFLMFHRCR